MTKTIIHNVWSGEPCLKDRIGQDVMGPVLLSRTLSDDQCIFFWCSDTHCESYQTRFSELGAKPNTIVVMPINATITNFCDPESELGTVAKFAGETIEALHKLHQMGVLTEYQKNIVSKELISMASIFFYGGYYLDTNIIPLSNRNDLTACFSTLNENAPLLFAEFGGDASKTKDIFFFSADKVNKRLFELIKFVYTRVTENYAKITTEGKFYSYISRYLVQSMIVAVRSAEYSKNSSWPFLFRLTNTEHGVATVDCSEMGIRKYFWRSVGNLSQQVSSAQQVLESAIRSNDVGLVTFLVENLKYDLDIHMKVTSKVKPTTRSSDKFFQKAETEELTLTPLEYAEWREMTEMKKVISALQGPKNAAENMEILK